MMGQTALFADHERKAMVEGIKLSMKIEKTIRKTLKKEIKMNRETSMLCNYTCFSKCISDLSQANMDILYPKCAEQCLCYIVSKQTNALISQYREVTQNYT
jgi:ferredoxin-like protein FixX